MTTTNRIIAGCLLLLGAASMQAQSASPFKAGSGYKEWVKTAPRLDDSFFGTPEAASIGENVLLYQQTTGGWPKNINMAESPDDEARARARRQKDDTNLSTIDNGATTTEIRYLSRLYLATQTERYRDAALRGIGYLLNAQYDNGGWPQFWPRNKGYYTHITYNDNAMVNVMNLLRDVAEGRKPYAYVPDSIRRRAQAAFDRGVECILNTQVRQDGRLTVWCAQHDEHTLAPAKARAYELPSLSGAESDNVVLLLMSLPHPSDRVRQAVEAAVAWFRQVQIDGLRREYFTDAEGRRDYRMVPCADGDDCPPLWARFYTLEDNRPFFCDRDGIPRHDISQIGHERRNGYSWYNSDGTKVLRRYEQWKKEAGN